MMTHRMTALVLAGLIFTTGCSKNDKTEAGKPAAAKTGGAAPASLATRTNDLKEVALLYLSFLDKNSNKPAKQVEDFSALAGDFPAALAGLKDGRYKIFWSARMPGDAQKIVAYEADTPTKGGLTVNLMGEVKTMTADEFKTAPKAGSGN